MLRMININSRVLGGNLSIIALNIHKLREQLYVMATEDLRFYVNINTNLNDI